MSRKGRPCELTPAMIADAQRLAASVEYIESVAVLLGVSKSTLFNWLRRGTKEERRRDRGLKPIDGENLFIDFLHSIKRGRVESEQRSLDTIRAAADGGQWQAAAWRLERSHPERWSLQKQELVRLRKIVKRLAEKQGIDAETLETKTDE